jgi:hypothetical protein
MTRFALTTLTAGALVAALPTTASVVVDFESDPLGTIFGGATDWQLSGTDSSALEVVETTTSGLYVGGQALQSDEGGSTVAGLALPITFTPTALQADMNWAFSGTPGSSTTPTIQVIAWEDASEDGIFSSGERSVGLAMDNTELDFEFLNGGSEIDGDTSTTFSADTWYRITLTWSDPDGAGNRDLTLSAFDLTNSSDLGVVNTTTVDAATFGGDPDGWDGVGIRITRGTIDNITVIPEPSSLALLGLGGLLIARRRRG